MFYANLVATTKKKLVVDNMKDKEESKHTTPPKKNQITKEYNKRERMAQSNYKAVRKQWTKLFNKEKPAHDGFSREF